MTLKAKIIEWIKTLDRQAMLACLANFLSNLGVIGIGLAFWQKGDVAAWIGGTCCIVIGLITSGMVKK